MGVQIDHSGNDDLASAADNLRCGMVGLYVARRPDRDDFITGNGDRAALQVSSPKGVRLMADRDARAAYGHTPSQLPNEILRPGGTR